MNKSDALQRAAVLAMRDAAALVIIKFDEVTGISSLGNSTPTASTPVAVPVSDTVDRDEVQSIALEGQQDDAS